jgi:hypothetical protein
MIFWNSRFLLSDRPELFGGNMMKYTVFCGIILMVFSSCVGLPLQQVSVPPVDPLANLSPEQRFWFTAADGGGLIIVGSSARRVNREETLSMALQNAAVKVAAYNQVQGYVESREIQQAGFMGYSSAVEGEISPTFEDHDYYYNSYAESLEFDPETDILERDNALFVRVRVPATGGHIITHPAATVTPGQPGWIGVPPVFPGFNVGVGYGAPQSNISYALNASYKDAILKIIGNVSSSVSVSHEESNEGMYSSVTERTSSSQSTLKGFYVLEIWIDPQTTAVWTLAVAQQ